MKKTVFYLSLFFTLNLLVPSAQTASSQCYITNHIAAKVLSQNHPPYLTHQFHSLTHPWLNVIKTIQVLAVIPWPIVIFLLYTMICSVNLVQGISSFSHVRLLSIPRSYPYLEAYFCLACSPSQPLATDSSTGVKTVQICKSFVEKFWASDITKVKIDWVIRMFAKIFIFRKLILLIIVEWRQSGQATPQQLFFQAQ